MKATIDEMEKCQDEEEFGCSSKKKDKMIDDASKVQEDNDNERTPNKKREEMMKKFQGGEKDSAGKEKAPMSVKLPDGCTTKEDCNWICTKMAKASGANFDAIDMKDQESLDGETKYTKARRERILEGDGISLENDVVNDGSGGGYEPDSEENTEGLDSSFSETVDSEVDGGGKKLFFVSLFSRRWFKRNNVHDVKDDRSLSAYRHGRAFQFSYHS